MEKITEQGRGQGVTPFFGEASDGRIGVRGIHPSGGMYDSCCP